MATSLTDAAKNDDWAELHPIVGGDPAVRRAERLWTLFGLTLLGAFLVFVAANAI